MHPESESHKGLPINNAGYNQNTANVLTAQLYAAQL